MTDSAPTSTLSQLFALDPNKCTKNDIQEIIKAYRDRRAQFNIGNMSAGKIKAPSAAMQQLEKVAKIEIDL